MRMTVARRDRGWRYRTAIGVRAGLALVGSYAVAALAATILARTLPGDRISAAIWATLSGLLIPVPVALGIFLARSAARAAIYVVAGAIVLTVVVRLTGPVA